MCVDHYVRRALCERECVCVCVCVRACGQQGFPRHTRMHIIVLGKCPFLSSVYFFLSYVYFCTRKSSKLNLGASAPDCTYASVCRCRASVKQKNIVYVCAYCVCLHLRVETS
jgi:hypothetical protein